MNTPQALCPDCQAEIAATVAACPQCGADFTAVQGWRPYTPSPETVGFCPNCANQIPSDATSCPECNADFTAENGWRPQALHPPFKRRARLKTEQVKPARVSPAQAKVAELTQIAQLRFKEEFDKKLAGNIAINAGVVIIGLILFYITNIQLSYTLLLLIIFAPIAMLEVIIPFMAVVLVLAVVIYALFRAWLWWRSRHGKHPSLTELIALGIFAAIPFAFLPKGVGDLLFEDFARAYLTWAICLAVMGYASWVLYGRSTRDSSTPGIVESSSGFEYVAWMVIAAPLTLFIIAETSRLHDAVAAKDHNKIISSLKPWKSINSRDRKGRTPLAIAIAIRDPEAVSILMANGAKIVLQDRGGSGRVNDHLLLAVKSKDLEIVKRMLVEPLQQEVSRQHLASALQEAQHLRLPEIVYILKRAEESIRPVHSQQ